MNLTHHSYIFVSSSPDKSLSVLSTKLSQTMPGYTVLPFVISRINIKDVRMLSEYAYGSAPQILLVATDDILPEAQQALLKTLEEPGAQTKIVFIMPHFTHLLPTIISRVEVLYDESENTNSVYEEEMQKFIKSDVPGRLKWVEKFIKDNEDHDTTRSIAKRYVDALTQILINKINKSSLSKDPKSVVVLEDLEYASSNLLTRGSSVKIIFEHIAITLPNF